jgi:hypothetical protein
VLDWRRIFVLGAFLVGGCAGTEEPEPAAAPEPATEFTWTTTLDQAGYGYELTVEGIVGDGHASYSMQVEPILAGGAGGDDVVAALAATSVNGEAPDGEGVATSLGAVSTDGSTRVAVVGADRWYLNPWLVQQADEGEAAGEWVHVRRGDAVIADIATAVLNERYDEAVRHLLDAVASGSAVEAPTPGEQSSELDETLTPWIGLVGPAFPIGAPATVEGDANAGSASWRHVSTPEVHGVDAVMAGAVRWRSTTEPRTTEPSSAVDVAEITAELGG